MLNSVTRIDAPVNEPVLSHAPGTPERARLQASLRDMALTPRDLTLVIDGQEVRGNDVSHVAPPHRHRDVIARLHGGDASHVQQAIAAATRARKSWGITPFEERAGVFLRAAELLAGRYRSIINAATMLGQSKTAHQAEIDAACELIDFWRFNVFFAKHILSDQPISPTGVWNRMDYRPLDGFVLAVTPFNFTSIAGNLPTAPALMGNTVVWKPATTQALSAQIIMDVLIGAGLPAGVINMVHAPGRVVGDCALTHADLGGVHFTGSTATFNSMWATVASNMASFKGYPRLVGETGGKDFVIAHSSADVEALAVALVRGAFEYQGQKCSAASRAYIPQSLWPELSARLEAEIGRLKVGDIANFQNFLGAVIDAKSFKNIKGYIDYARQTHGGEVWLGGECDDREGYFIKPTVVLADDPKHRLMCEEIFGPVLTIHRYPDHAFAETLTLVDSTSPYALTGAIFARDRAAVQQAMDTLRFAAGNFYINDKPTGAVVGQQPFGGARASGTNDKAGSFLNLVRWTSARAIKETFAPAREVGYPFMLE